MQLVLAELKKHRAFRETWVGYILGLIYLLLSLYNHSLWTSDIPQEQFSLIITQNWFSIQQDIYSYGAALTAFLLVIGLPRLICCEKERGTDCLIGTTENGRGLTWRAKVLFTVIYCAIVVWAIGAISLLAHYLQFGLKGALWPVTRCLYFYEEALPPVSNLSYCILQYGFLFLGALYFAGFVLITAAITRRTALTLFLCGGGYLAFLVYSIFGNRIQGTAFRLIFQFLFRFGFSGFLFQESYSWTFWGDSGNWADVWKPVLMVLALTVIEFAVLWLLWRHRARK